MHGDQCISNLKQIGLAARMWGTDHQNRLPSDFVTMREALSVKALVCPGDTQRVAKAVSDWSQVSPAGISYELVSPGILEAERAKVYVKCPVHNYVLFADGLAQKYPKRVE